jgi:CubicO group peptidase (beta-lactamase class C family)
MKIIFRTAVLLWTVVVIAACKQPGMKEDNSLSSFILAKADSLYKSEHVTGIFIGVLDNGKKSYYSFGYADPDKKMPFDSATLFEIGSITKTFTAFVLESVLKEKGIDDNSSIINYLPDSVKTNKALKDISFLSLLNHTSGLPRLPDNMDLFSDFMTPYDHYTADQFFSYLKNCKPAPDGKSNYSNLGSGLAGVLAQKIAGREYFDLLDQYIFTPFGLGKSNKTIEGISNKAQGYFQGNKALYWGMSVMGPAYVLKSTSFEVLSYLDYMSNPSDSTSNQVIDKLLEPTLTIIPGTSVCRAWHTIERENRPVIYWHNGSTYGFSTFGGFIKGQRKAVIVVTNHFNKAAVSDVLGTAIMKKISE